jgi:tetratricopeptide (TPR) repeat protein
VKPRTGATGMSSAGRSELHQISGCEKAERKADVVFVHGLGGDAFTTWRYGEADSTSWPHWFGQEFPEVGVWSLGYAASPTKWARLLGWFFERWRGAGHGLALPDRALQVLDLMAQRGLGERPLFFICHSLGGLVAKQILRTSSDHAEGRLNNVFKSTHAVLFLATPHRGAALASLVDLFRIVFGATVTIQDLRAHDAHLRNLFDWYRSHAGAAGIRTASYYETQGVTIVNPTSADAGVGADPIGLDEDHRSIAKPREPGFQVCGAARDLLRNHVLKPRPAPTVPIAPSPVAPTPLLPITVNIQAPTVGGGGSVPTPHELPPAAQEFFGRQVELALLTERLRSGRSTAVVGPAGLGKTALAAQALLAVVGDTASFLADSPFPDGVVYLDLYAFHGKAEPAWDSLASKLAGAGFMERSPARQRATGACQARHLLVVIEGGEEADGQDGRASMSEILSVLSPQNRWLLLTRLNTQAATAETVLLREALHPEDAARLFDALTNGRLTAAVRGRALELLQGHPLALTWAGNLLARDDDDPERLISDWMAEQLPSLSDPRQAEHTLEWVFSRGARGLDDTARRVLAATALLSRAPFPLAAINAALRDSDHGGGEAGRHALKCLVQRSLLRRSEGKDHWQFTHVLSYRFARKEMGSDPALRVRLGRWLHGHLVTALAADAVCDGPLSIDLALEHLAALLRADDDQSLWDPLAKSTLYQISDRLNDMGRLAQVKLALGAVAGWLERFPADKAQEPDWRRERSILINRQGDVLRDQGDLAGALASYRASLQLSRRLAEADPSNAGWQRDLSVSQDNVASVLRDQGDLAGALASYRASLQLRRRLAEADPSNAGWQRDLSVSQDNVANVLRDQGDLAGALASYRESLQLRRRLAEADPSNAVWQRDLSFSLTTLAEFHERQGDRTEALPLAQESLMIDERLAALDRSNAIWQKDVAVSRALVARLRR